MFYPTLLQLLMNLHILLTHLANCLNHMSQMIMQKEQQFPVLFTFNHCPYLISRLLTYLNSMIQNLVQKFNSTWIICSFMHHYSEQFIDYLHFYFEALIHRYHPRYFPFINPSYLNQQLPS